MTYKINILPNAEEDLNEFRQQSKKDYLNCLILADAQHRQLVLHTFDRKLARLHGAKPVEDSV